MSTVTRVARRRPGRSSISSEPEAVAGLAAETVVPRGPIAIDVAGWHERARPAPAPDRAAAPRVHRVDIDLVRLICALSVITIHVTRVYVLDGIARDERGETFWAAVALNAPGHFASCVFFALAGWGLLTRSRAGDEGAWLGRRLRRLALPLLVWGVGYAALEAILFRLDRRVWPWPPADPLAWLQGQAGTIAFGPGPEYHLWFLYLLIPTTIVIWLVQAMPRREWPEDRRHWIVYGLTASALLLSFGLTTMLHIQISWSTFGWVIGYACLGYFLLNGPRPPLALSAAVFAAGTAIVVYASLATGYEAWPFVRPGPFVLAMTIGLVWMARAVRIPRLLAAHLPALGSMLFGVYLSHPLVIHAAEPVVNNVFLVPGLGPLRMLVLWAVTVPLTFMLVAAWRRSPRLRLLLG